MKDYKKVLIIVCIVLLGIGFAALSASLYINGNTMISGNQSDFQVIYDTTYTEERTVAYINGFQYSINDPVYNSTTEMVFEPTKGLLTADDRYEVPFKLLNNSSMYDAVVNITCTTTDGSDFYPFGYMGDISNLKISAKGTYEGKIIFKLYSQTEDDLTKPFKCELKAEAKSRNSIAS